MSEGARNLLKKIWNVDFSSITDAHTFIDVFFSRRLSLKELKITHDWLTRQTIKVEGKTIPAAYLSEVKSSDKLPFLLLTQVHGNEPAGLAAVLFTLALGEAGFLKRSVYLAIGNPFAAGQYFSAWEKNPSAQQEVRDDFRTGVDEKGNMQKDLNRVPANFLELDPASDHHTKRAQDLYYLSKNISGILDIHSARGNLTCITTYSNERDLLYSPIRTVLKGLLDSIASHTSTKPLKLLFSSQKNIESNTGIEAGRHEDINSFKVASSFTLSLFFNLGISSIKPEQNETGVFDLYHVKDKLKFSDLEIRLGKSSPEEDLFYTIKPIINKTPADKVVIEKDDRYQVKQKSELKGENPLYAVYQFEEIEEISEGQEIAIGIPSGTKLLAKSNFTGIFFAKPAELYRDKSVVLLPVHYKELNNKFCFPCRKDNLKIKI